MASEPLKPPGEKRGRGRPPKPPGEAGEARSVNLPAWQWEWLRSQSDGASATVRRLIEKEIRP